ncbi:hypothetical protein [Nitrospira sp. Nam74]
MGHREKNGTEPDVKPVSAGTKAGILETTYGGTITSRISSSLNKSGS